MIRLHAVTQDMEPRALVRAARRVPMAIRRDWGGPRALAGGAVVTALAVLLVWLFHTNHPNPFIPFHDTWEYAHSADRIASGGPWADPARMPGYPLLLALVFLLTGKDNLAAANFVQYALFVASAVAVYALAYRVWRQTRLALLIGALFATNLYVLSYVKAILSDGLAMLLAILLAIAVVAFIERPVARRLWLVAALLLAVTMTRAEWDLLPIPLFAFLLFVARRRARLSRLLPHAAASVAAIYGAIGAYVYQNFHVNGFLGLTDAENINLYGKVTQYGMQNQAPPRYAPMAAITNSFVERKVTDPWLIYWRDPALGSHHFARMGAYARAVILHHPGEFLARSIPVFFKSLYSSSLFAGIVATGPHAGALHAIQACSALVFLLFMLFPAAALLWWLALCVRRDFPRPRLTAQLCALSLLSVYELAATTVGSYNAYTRLHLTVDPLMLIVVVGTIFTLVGRSALFNRRPTRRDKRSQQVDTSRDHSQPAEEPSAA